jgi:hypothetical protein
MCVSVSKFPFYGIHIVSREMRNGASLSDKIRGKCICIPIMAMMSITALLPGCETVADTAGIIVSIPFGIAIDGPVSLLTGIDPGVSNMVGNLVSTGELKAPHLEPIDPEVRQQALDSISNAVSQPAPYNYRSSSACVVSGGGVCTTGK